MIIRTVCCTVFLLSFITFIEVKTCRAQQLQWKKLVSREITIPVQARDKHKKKDRPKAQTLAAMMADVVKAGNAVAYSNLDMSLTTAMDKREVIYYDETVYTNQEPTDYSGIDRYRVLEEWTLDPLTYAVQIRITGIAPVRNVYGDDGVFRGVRGMFWLRYADVQPILAAYDKEHPGQSVQRKIWKENFAKAGKLAGKQWQCFATRSLDMPAANEDTVTHRLKEQAPCMTTLKVLYIAQRQSMRYGQKRFDTGMVNKLGRMVPADGSLDKIDTVTILDPVTGLETRRLIWQDEPKGKIKVIEQWSFDQVTGKTAMHIVGIAPTVVVSDGGLKERTMPVFWLPYGDVQQLIADNDAYCPEHSFAFSLWNNYFLSDVKPEIVK